MKTSRKISTWKKGLSKHSLAMMEEAGYIEDPTPNVSSRCHHITSFKTLGKTYTGHFVIGIHCGAFGEPNGIVDFWFNPIEKGVQKSTEGAFHMSPEGAIELGYEIIKRAKQARAQRKRWDRKHIPGYEPLEPIELDLEDREALP